MRTELFWIDGTWRGRLAIMPRPRGGDWLPEEILSWRRAGVDMVVTLLTAEERTEFELHEEENLCGQYGMEFLSFPIKDRDVPPSLETFFNLVNKLAEQLENGKTIAVHCRQGIGRAGLVAIALLIQSGLEPSDAMARVGSARGCTVPETPEQRRWISDFAKFRLSQLLK